MRISIVIPTYNREEVLVNTIDHLLQIDLYRSEILVIDQTKNHQNDTEQKLSSLEKKHQIVWIRIQPPCIPHAMNVGLKHASGDIVIFLDDDIIPSPQLIGAHLQAHFGNSEMIVAGQIIQPNDTPGNHYGNGFCLSSSVRQLVTEFGGGNFSVKRKDAIAVGGFDENFVHVAYRFEAEFAHRALKHNFRILYEPTASIRHLKVSQGGTRSYGEHLKTFKPGHSVGLYYWLLVTQRDLIRLKMIIYHFLQSIKARFYLSHPWWIPATFLAHGWGLLQALRLYSKGSRRIKMV